MRVLLAGPTYPERMPYVRNFTNALSRLDVPYDLLYWDRRPLGSISTPENIIRFHHPHRDGDRLHGLFGYSRFGASVRQTLAQGNYTHFIALGAMVAMLAGASDQRKRRWVDIRDLGFEDTPLVGNWLRRRLLAAAMASISSKAFESFLPQREYVLSHNTTVTEPNPLPMPANRTVAYVGSPHNVPDIVNLAKTVLRAEDWRFAVHGDSYDSNALRVNMPKEVEFTGEYSPEQEREMYARTGVVVATYGADCQNTRTALPNKLYRAAIYGRPIVASTGTYLAEVVQEAGLGYSFPQDASAIPDCFAPYWHPDKRRELLANAESFLATVERDQLTFEARLADWLG